MHESEAAQPCPNLSYPMDCSLPGKSTGVGCHCLLHLLCAITVKYLCLTHSCIQCHYYFILLWGKNTGVGFYALFQGIFPNQGSNPGPPALEADSLPSEPLGKPLIDPEFLINGVSHFFLYHTQLEFVIALPSGLHYYYEQSAFTCIIVVHQKKYSFPFSFYKIFPSIWCLPV